MLTDKDIPDLIVREIRSLLLDQEGESASLAPEDTLASVGLNSLMLAQLLIQLEETLGVDPFGEDVSIADIRSIADLANAYERALTAEAAA
ncbi:acyl carrier protein [Actinacidiphila sp. ITFR-21]|uniref:acyl carrier protein n=1 Tax=Actinacidiphila sp. ITFR-21 TaxID=3075199 RepID=UPI002889705A|nr:acyl carrier protein [Streptomyces sp. ITFR-21]WNI17846.1 acyl carrier protein [Streptomyces sp. ITFR-21]